MVENNIKSHQVNRDFLIKELNLHTSSSTSVYFEGKNIIAISPAIQNNRFSFDLQRNTMLKVKSSNKKAFLIIRFFNEFLVKDLDVIAEELLREDTIHTYNDGRQKWALTVNNRNNDYSVSVYGYSQEVMVEKLFKEEVKDWVAQQMDGNKIKKSTIVEVKSGKEIVRDTYSYISSRGFQCSIENIKNLYLSLRTKPFIIISGISGTGKTKIVQLFAEAIGATEENEQFKLIPVRPDWSDSSDLLGYRDIKGEFWKGPLTKIVEHALANPDLPHFVLLDEMNLARVEYYFSDVLSVMESRKKDEEGNFTSSPLITFEENEEEKTVTLPGNLYVIGTVNMDETTHSFSKKVLDRANTIEFNEIDLMNFDAMMDKKWVEPIRVSNDVLESTYIHLIDAFSAHEPLIRQVSEKINAINESLKVIHAQVGYRVRDEISFYMAHNAEAGMLLTENEAMDFCIMQKILPRISGTQNIVEPVLEKLEIELKPYEKCSKKIEEMKKRLDDNGFVSFWTA
ncbi:McrB family protein [Lysinibacillus sp. BW-2-10]|uniref:McrB family protein n=1 Tax=Lysinibacillus sp. BW-2-10 TaxID=2590030 RepID=UPI00117FC7D1|nr:AAA family ATPase [Lysinibacillus sp. BW-2-10]TSI09742.1 hypothetical protein FJQ64_05050 [Lysinibacillus sp. BW-2-10]